MGIKKFLKETKDFSKDFFIDTKDLDLKSLARYGTGYDAWKAFRRFNQTDTGKLTGIVGTVVAAYFTAGASMGAEGGGTAVAAEGAAAEGATVAAGSTTAGSVQTASQAGFAGSNQVPNMLTQTGTNVGNQAAAQAAVQAGGNAAVQTGGEAAVQTGGGAGTGFGGSNQVPNLMTETGTNVGNNVGLGGKVLSGLKGTGAWVKDNSMLAYLMMNTVGSMLSDPMGDQAKMEAKREARKQKRIDRNTDLSEIERTKPSYKRGSLSLQERSARPDTASNPGGPRGIIDRNQRA